MHSRDPNNVRGIDVSNLNGTVDWAKVTAAGYAFAFAKATEGITYKDATFATNYKGMKDAGLIRGAYHYAHPGEDNATAEADAFVDTVLTCGGFDGLPPVLDIEVNEGLSSDKLIAWVAEWVLRVKARTGKMPIIYSYVSFLNKYIPHGFGNYPLWIADYGVAAPPQVSTWTRWALFQYSDAGDVPGISGRVDLNEFSGDINTLRRFCGITAAADELSVGSSGDNVKSLQANLKLALSLGDTFALDGVYGPSTEAAVRSFQLINKLPVTGIADDRTTTALVTSAAKAQSSAPVEPSWQTAAMAWGKTEGLIEAQHNPDDKPSYADVLVMFKRFKDSLPAQLTIEAKPENPVTPQQ